jgi:hypothetical protein
MLNRSSSKTQSVALARFVAARLEAYRIMREAGTLEGLPALCQVQADAIAGLSGLKLHRIVGEADAADFFALRDDIEAIAAQVDPLIAAIGSQAAGASRAIERDLFEAQLSGALDGNATFNLDEAAARVSEDRAAFHPGSTNPFAAAAE